MGRVWHVKVPELYPVGEGVPPPPLAKESGGRAPPTVKNVQGDTPRGDARGPHPPPREAEPSSVKPSDGSGFPQGGGYPCPGGRGGEGGGGHIKKSDGETPPPPEKIGPPPPPATCRHGVPCTGDECGSSGRRLATGRGRVPPAGPGEGGMGPLHSPLQAGDSRCMPLQLLPPCMDWHSTAENF